MDAASRGSPEPLRSTGSCPGRNTVARTAQRRRSGTIGSPRSSDGPSSTREVPCHNRDAGRAGRRPRGEGPGRRSMPAKILVVDDDPNVQRLLQYTLKQEGYEVVVAGDGAEGSRLWGAESPDLILLDVMLPKLDGYQVATKIRTDEGAAGQVPIIMLTAEREVEQKVRGLRAGADDYLIKPFHPAELMARIKSLLA